MHIHEGICMRRRAYLHICVRIGMVYIYIYILDHPHEHGCDTNSSFKQILTGWSFEFSISHSGYHMKAN